VGAKAPAPPSRRRCIVWGEGAKGAPAPPPVTARAASRGRRSPPAARGRRGTSRRPQTAPTRGGSTTRTGGGRCGCGVVGRVSGGAWQVRGGLPQHHAPAAGVPARRPPPCARLPDEQFKTQAANEPPKHKPQKINQPVLDGHVVLVVKAHAPRVLIAGGRPEARARPGAAAAAAAAAATQAPGRRRRGRLRRAGGGARAGRPPGAGLPVPGRLGAPPDTAAPSAPPLSAGGGALQPTPTRQCGLQMAPVWAWRQRMACVIDGRRRRAGGRAGDPAERRARAGGGAAGARRAAPPRAAGRPPVASRGHAARAGRAAGGAGAHERRWAGGLGLRAYVKRGVRASTQTNAQMWGAARALCRPSSPGSRAGRERGAVGMGGGGGGGGGAGCGQQAGPVRAGTDALGPAPSRRARARARAGQWPGRGGGGGGVTRAGPGTGRAAARDGIPPGGGRA
jgi:hypothetical protein